MNKSKIVLISDGERVALNVNGHILAPNEFTLKADSFDVYLSMSDLCLNREEIPEQVMFNLAKEIGYDITKIKQ